jgi:hypothetical protein
MTTTAQTVFTAEAIYSFSDRDQKVCHVAIPATAGGEASEAGVLFAVLAPLTDGERDSLAKVSLCFLNVADLDAASAALPWLFCKASPLFGGKLWLQQHTV